jgi:hypothetical protein
MRSISRVASEHQPPMGYQSNIVLLQLMKMSSPCCIINFIIEICFKTNTLEQVGVIGPCFYVVFLKFYFINLIEIFIWTLCKLTATLLQIEQEGMFTIH